MGSDKKAIWLLCASILAFAAYLALWGVEGELGFKIIPAGVLAIVFCAALLHRIRSRDGD